MTRRLALCTLMLLLAATAAQAEERGLCSPDEEVAFTCRMARNDKLLSVCASPGLLSGTDTDRADAYLQYRYGKSGAVELEYPARRDGSIERFRFSRHTAPDTTYLRLHFVNKGVDYTVFDDDHCGDRAAGVELTLPGGNGLTLPCEPGYESELLALEELVPPGE